MKRKTLLVASLVVALVLGMSIIPAGAYFTDSDSANGGIQVKVKPSTDIKEYVNDGVKEVVISNDAEATSAVYVRAGVFTTLDAPISGSHWAGPNGKDWTGPANSGWFDYDAILQPGESTDGDKMLKVEINFPEVKDEGVDTILPGDNANVIVVYEATPVLYDEDGNPYADWTLKANQEPKAPEGGE